MKIDIATGNTAKICDLNTQDGYPSSTFDQEGTLFGSNNTQQRLDKIDPCTCQITEVGPTNAGSIPGITANGIEVQLLFGLSVSLDQLFTLSKNNGNGVLVGDLGLDFHWSGTTWSEDANGLFSINDLTDKLYAVNPNTGMATEVADLSVDFTSVGMEWHPETKELYACTDSGGTKLYKIDTNNGQATEINTLPASCNNLAAPWTEVQCVDEIEI